MFTYSIIQQKGKTHLVFNSKSGFVFIVLHFLPLSTSQLFLIDFLSYLSHNNFYFNND